MPLIDYPMAKKMLNFSGEVTDKTTFYIAAVYLADWLSDLKT